MEEDARDPTIGDRKQKRADRFLAGPEHDRGLTVEVPHLGLQYVRAACADSDQKAGNPVRTGNRLGEIAAAVRAGVPSIVVPHMGDQFAWAKILQQRGLSGPWVAAQRLTVDWLAHHLASTLEETMLAQRARALAELVRAEDGVGEATQRIEAAWNAGQLGAR